jgi:hypothetical protein
LADNFDKYDQKDMEKDRVDAKKNKDDHKEFKAALKDRRKVFREKIKAEKKAEMKSRNRKRYKNPLTKAEIEQRRRYPTNVIPGSLEIATVKAMAPPGCTVYHDTWNGRWSLSLDGYVRSRSWLKYGHSESALLVLAKMWERFMDLYGLDECPVPGLMEDARQIKKKEAAEVIGALDEAGDPIEGSVPVEPVFVPCAAASSSGPMVPLGPG